jgi:hypothetical protein
MDQLNSGAGVDEQLTQKEWAAAHGVSGLTKLPNEVKSRTLLTAVVGRKRSGKCRRKRGRMGQPLKPGAKVQSWPKVRDASGRRLILGIFTDRRFTCGHAFS